MTPLFNASLTAEMLFACSVTYHAIMQTLFSRTSCTLEKSVKAGIGLVAPSQPSLALKCPDRLEEDRGLSDDGLAEDRLLSGVEHDGHHGYTAVENLRLAHQRRVLPEWIKAKHAGNVVGAPFQAKLQVQIEALGVHRKCEHSEPVRHWNSVKAAVKQ
eukprot:6180184-Pleurochrysis_carterae.AAC.1